MAITCDPTIDGLFGICETNHEKPATKLTVPARATKTFRSYDQDQMFLLPPSLDEWLLRDHSARFISEMVEKLVDFDAIYASDTGTSGASPHDPR